MSSYNTLLMRKGEEIKSSLKDFGFATGEIPYMAKIEAKELASLDCPGEDGDRVFFPDRMSLKAYDIKIEFKYYGEKDTVYPHYSALRDYLTGYDGAGTKLDIYSPYCSIGRKDVYFKEMGDPKFRRDINGECIVIEAVFRITDPVTDIYLSKE